MKRTRRLILTFATIASLHGAGAHATGMTAAATKPTRDQIAQAQQALRQEGFYVATDGTLNFHTVQALRAYQQKNQLPVTGMLDETSMQALGIEDPVSAAREQAQMRAAAGR